MSGFKTEAVVCHDPNESELNSFDDDNSKNVVFKILDEIHEEDKGSVSNVSRKTELRGLSERFLRWRRSHLPVDGDHKRVRGSGKRSGPLLSGTAYCISSCSMIIINKIVLSSYNFNAGISLMFYQNLISCLVVAVLDCCGAVSVEKLNWKLIKVWIPVNVIFVGMLVSGMYSLKYINVAMVTILKNATNIITAIGELYMFRKRQNNKVWAAMFMMIISAISSGITDLTFDSVGYTWQIANCILTASYSLILRRVMDKAKQSTRSGSLNEVSMVILNNLLSLPFAVMLIILLGEWRYVITTDVIRVPMFWVVATASGFLGLAISFTSMWFLHQTGPTTYSLVGSLNKVPISIAGLVLFKVPLSLPNLFSILFGLFAGIFFARAKMS
ncbi:PREDICTED: GDP-mannose transporter GONST2 isoform X1 [Tarenaya hassleriana]|uniref:GDP-mannose transporter GONST2 isoform X1 n=2 Tax=Tarenaya hassleriana TaxID=28532 RepID=UPI00053C38B1|nr:PREDICTED: GDP-mannose transporter GONST2 isoform X1 [Tarenaya hassleriana]XP_010557215.1 PREDICTED: GDP-mannose transporter GONST2 isoform X1 [Tarenaya hassleriana]